MNNARYLKQKISECMLMSNRMLIDTQGEGVELLHQTTNFLVQADICLEQLCRLEEENTTTQQD